jgi:hypothetical protein
MIGRMDLLFDFSFISLAGIIEQDFSQRPKTPPYNSIWESGVSDRLF